MIWNIFRQVFGCMFRKGGHSLCLDLGDPLDMPFNPQPGDNAVCRNCYAEFGVV